MKIEKLSKDNIKEFIRDMKLDEESDLELNVDKRELFGIKKEENFCLGFDSLAQVDAIAILYYNSRISNDDFYECIDFLNKSLVVENHLIIEIYNEKYMKLLDEKYRCKDMNVALKLRESTLDIIQEKKSMKEDFIDIEMKSIKYNYSKNMILCNLVKQNIQDERLIFALHDHFNTLDIDVINFVIYSDSLEYLETLGYKCFSKNYVIRNDLF